MATFKTKANVADNGTLTVVGLPFKPGEQVEVTIEPIEEVQEEKERYPLRGKPYKYDRPFESVALARLGQTGAIVPDTHLLVVRMLG